MQLTVEFGGGLEGLVKGNKKCALLNFESKDTISCQDLIKNVSDTLIESRKDLFCNTEPPSIKPGILVLINDCDWELKGGLSAQVKNNDTRYAARPQTPLAATDEFLPWTYYDIQQKMAPIEDTEAREGLNDCDPITEDGKLGERSIEDTAPLHSAVMLEVSSKSESTDNVVTGTDTTSMHEKTGSISLNLLEKETSDIPVNKFSNDGSFLAMVLAQATNETSGDSVSSGKRVTAKGGPSSQQRPQQVGAKRQKVLLGKTNGKPGAQQGPKCSSPSAIVEGLEEDETDIKAKEEFLRAMKIMEEAGLVTEKGIGAGMKKYANMRTQCNIPAYPLRTTPHTTGLEKNIKRNWFEQSRKIPSERGSVENPSWFNEGKSKCIPGNNKRSSINSLSEKNSVFKYLCIKPNGAQTASISELMVLGNRRNSKKKHSIGLKTYENISLGQIKTSLELDMMDNSAFSKLYLLKNFYENTAIIAPGSKIDVSPVGFEKQVSNIQSFSISPELYQKPKIFVKNLINSDWQGLRHSDNDVWTLSISRRQSQDFTTTTSGTRLSNRTCLIENIEQPVFYNQLSNAIVSLDPSVCSNLSTSRKNSYLSVFSRGSNEYFTPRSASQTGMGTSSYYSFSDTSSRASFFSI